MRDSERTVQGAVLVDGAAAGPVLKLSEPLNAWGGLDPDTGVIVHHSHPQRGQSLAGRVLVMPESRGSGTNAQVFAQAWANGHGPMAVLLAEPDFVLCVGAVVSNELYKVRCPVVVLTAADYDALLDDDHVSVTAGDGKAVITMHPRTPRGGTPMTDRSDDSTAGEANATPSEGLVARLDRWLGGCAMLQYSTRHPGLRPRPPSQ